MKKLITILTVVLITTSVFAQAPQKMSYQAVIRNSSGALVANQSVGMRVSISTDSAFVLANINYREIYNPNPVTNMNGLVTVEIGGGLPAIGTFANINWAIGPYYIKTETDPTGGTNYTISGKSELLSVPYALFAGNVSNYSAGTGISIASNTITNTAPDQTVAITGTGHTNVTGTYPNFTVNTPNYTGGTGISVTGNTITNTAPDQTITLTGTGGTVVTGTYPNFTISTPNVVPTGTIISFAGAAIPTGWLLCDGSAVSRTTYSGLFTALASAWGSGDGSTTFNLPDLRGQFMRGVDGSAGNDPDNATRTASNAGGNTGNNVGTVESNGIGSHSHVLTVLATCAAGNTPTTSNYIAGGAGTWGPGTGCGGFVNNTTSISSIGGSETRPKNVYVNYIIKD